MTTYTQVLALLVWLVALPAVAQSLRITHVDVEQAAATLFVSPAGNSLLVDTGEDGTGTRIKAAMSRAGVTKIDHLVITHYHKDHLGGADELVAAPGAVEVINVYDRGDKAQDCTGSNSQFCRYQNALGHRARHLMRGETIPLDPAMLVTCIASGGVVLGEEPATSDTNENDSSVALLIQFGDFRYFVGGDLEAPTEGKIATRNLVTDVDVYQANHHGSDTSSRTSFLEDMKPTLVVIPNGNHAGHKHPRKVTLLALQGLQPSAPTILQVNKYTHGGTGGNVDNQFIADLEPDGPDGDILLNVEASGAYIAGYRGILLPAFQSKPRSETPAPVVSIVSMLPNPVGDDRLNEEIELRNNTADAVDLVGWFLRDEDLRVWALASLGQLPGGTSATIKRGGMAMNLDNTGETIELLNNLGAVVDRFTYAASAEGVRVQHP